MEHLTIRPAAIEDAAQILTYVQQVAGETEYLTFGADSVPLTLEDEKQFIQRVCKTDNCIMLVAETAGVIAGMLNFTASPKVRIRHYGEFGITVRKDFWGKGIGRKLIEHLIQWAKETGIVRKINLQARADNTRGIALYEKLGFQHEGRIHRGFYVNGTFYDTVVMGLEVD